ncbi:MAG: major capsid protein [Microviridae sp.]|nr:MAG: major capsid protein [Microviridae sp.]
MEKTLGGDRLGAGKKMKVHLHNYERSTHDMGYVWRSTAAAGTLIPFLCEVGLPGDTFDINLGCDIQTHPTLGPLFGSFKVQLDVFQAPIRLYQGMLHNNKLNIGRDMSKVKLPIYSLTARTLGDVTEIDLDNAQINPSCLLSYLGLRGIGMTDEPEYDRSFNGVPLLAYWDIYKNYYANKQEEIGAVIHTASDPLSDAPEDVQINGTTLTVWPTQTALGVGALTNIFVQFQNAPAFTLLEQVMVLVDGLGWMNMRSLMVSEPSLTPQGWVGYWNVAKYGNRVVRAHRMINATDLVTVKPKIETFALDQIDTMRENILGSASATTPFSINAQNLSPYSWLFEDTAGVNSIMSTMEGLGIKTYQSDLFNNWLSTEWIDGTGGIAEITAVSTVGDSFTLDSVILARKVYDMLNRIAVSGGTYDDWLDAVYTHDRYTRCESPMYMGGLIKELIFQEVISNSATEGNPLGALAGRGKLAGKHKGGSITVKVDEPSYIIGIFSLTPRVDYSQGNKWDVNLKTMDDLHKPALDEIGFQELITEQMAWWDTTEETGVWEQKSAGKQPAWVNYMTNVNKTYGNFAIASNEMFMTLNRRYEHTGNGQITDLTTYIDPSKFNYIFAETAIDAQNFWVQIGVDMIARRKMSAKLMPNL